MLFRSPAIIFFLFLLLLFFFKAFDPVRALVEIFFLLVVEVFRELLLGLVRGFLEEDEELLALFFSAIFLSDGSTTFLLVGLFFEVGREELTFFLLTFFLPSTVKQLFFKGEENTLLWFPRC